MIRCDGCGRHVRETETHCPFCSRSARRGAVAHKALQAMGGAATTVVLAACYGGPDMGYKDSYSPLPTGAASGTSTGIRTGTPTGATETLDVSIVWTDTDNLDPSDTNSDFINDVNCDLDLVDITIDDPLEVASWELGMAEIGSEGWTGEDCLYGYASFNICHPISAPTHQLTEVCTAGEVIGGTTTMLDSSKDPYLTYLLNDTVNGWCVVFGNDPSYYDSLGCETR